CTALIEGDIAWAGTTRGPDLRLTTRHRLPPPQPPQPPCRNYGRVARSSRATASGCCCADSPCRDPAGFTGRTGGREVRGGENAFLFLEDQNQEYFPREKAGGVEPAMALHSLAVARPPKILASRTSRPPVLL